MEQKVWPCFMKLINALYGTVMLRNYTLSFNYQQIYQFYGTMKQKRSVKLLSLQTDLAVI